MPIPIISPTVLNFPLPTDIMGRIAQSKLARIQAQTALPLAQANLARLQQQMQEAQQLTPARVARLRAQAQQAQALAGLAPLRQTLLRAQTAQAISEAAKPVPLTQQQQINESQKDAFQKLKDFGANDVRTISAFSRYAHLSNLTQLPKPVQPNATFPAPINATINSVNASTAPTSSTEATAVANATLPSSNIATPANKETFKPQLIQQNKLNDQATNILRGITEKTKEDPFEQAQAQGLSKEWSDINTDASQALEHEMPLFKTLLDDVKNVKTGPGAGYLLWATPAGQKLASDLTNAQVDKIKTVHLGRMTQLEFNKISRGIGTANMFPSALKKIFSQVIARDVEAREKSKFYHKYLQKGGRNLEEVDSQWIDNLPKVRTQAIQEANKIAVSEPTAEPTDIKGTSTEDLIKQFRGQ